MEQEFAEPGNESEESKRLKKYLLSNIKSETEREKIEEQIMLDDDFFEKVLQREEELIQEFADGELAPEEASDFLGSFLVTDERREKLNFARAFKNHLDLQATVGGKLPAKNVTKKYDKFWFSLFSFPRPNLAGAGLLFVLAAGSFLLWYFYMPQSNSRQAIASLNIAYRQARPLESRITSFNYSPFDVSRGQANDKIDLTERNRAERILLDNASENPTAENLHALGQLYLAKREFDEAIVQLEKVSGLASQNANVLNDLGVAYLEKSRQIEKNNVARSELAGRALENFDKALKIDPLLSTARFNKALCLQLLNLFKQARELWIEYLQLDSSSPWAGEARLYLQSLDSNAMTVIYSTKEIEEAFLNAFRAKNDEQAWQISRTNRELILEKYLPQKLAISSLEVTNNLRSGGNEFLEALTYLGELEVKRTGDAYARSLADYYRRRAASETRETKFLKVAQDSVKKGYQLCLSGAFYEAKNEFMRAQNLFLKAGNTMESVLSLHFVAYSLYNLNRKREAISLFQQVDSLTRERRYKWLNLMNRYWLVGGQEVLGYKSSTEVKNEYEHILTEAQNIGDSYLIQKLLLLLALRSHAVHQEEQTLDYLQRLVEASNSSGSSIRQKARNFGQGAAALSGTKYKSLAKAFILEGLVYGRETQDALLIINYEIDCGSVHTQTNDFDDARKCFLAAEDNIRKISEKTERDALLAKTFLKFGHLERKNNNFHEAIASYEKSLQMADGHGAAPGFLYEAQKSKLLSYQALGDVDKLEREIPAVINLAENYRDEILDEQERDSFFNNEQTVYDVAVDHKTGRGDFEQAFNYAEISNSRSLLDWLHQRANVVSSQKGLNVIFNNSVKPLDLISIRGKIPANVQILQYYVLDNKVIIWVLTQENFFTATVNIRRSELDEMITSYLNLLQVNRNIEQSAAAALAVKLYEILIRPIAVHLDLNKQLCLIPNKKLFVLPFAALIDNEGRYLLTRFVLFYAPSANTFILCTENAGKKQRSGNESFLGVGNPEFSPRKFTDLPDLPDAASEVAESSRNYANHDLLLGEKAIKKSFEKLASIHDIIHFAGHYLVQNGSPLSSGLLFSSTENDKGGELFTNGEILKTRLPETRLIILSACQTGIEDHYTGEGLIGLSRTFLATGVPLVVGSQWKVDSRATARLMTDLHHSRRHQKLSTVIALRQSQLQMLGGASGNYQAPYFWAAFAAFGGYAEF